MNTDVFVQPRLSAIACRACGGVLCPPMRDAVPELPDVCQSCWTRFEQGRKQWLSRTSVENDFNRFLARRIHLAAKMYEKVRTLGRCEAVSNWAQGRGFQCALLAVTERDGRRVCTRHGEIAVNVDYVTGSVDPYQHFRDLIVRVGLSDEKFAAVIRSAAASLEQG